MKNFKVLDTPGPFSGIEYRRTTRLERSVPLVLFGQNNHGQSFQEKTCTISFNLHGCRYPSRHNCCIGTRITVQVTGSSRAANPAAKHARVKSIHAPNGPRECYQIGIELETPENIWEILSPPEDWLRASDPVVSRAQPPTAAARERAHGITKMSLPSRKGLREPEPWSAYSIPIQTQAPKRFEEVMESDPPETTRIVVSSDELVASLEGKLQLAADKAVRSALITHLAPAVEKAVACIEEACQANADRPEHSMAQHLETLLDSSQGEVLDGMNSIPGELRSQRREKIEKDGGQAEDASQRLKGLAGAATHDAAKPQELAERLVRGIEQRLSTRLSQAVARAVEEFERAAVHVSDRQFVRLGENIKVITREAVFQVEARAAEACSTLETVARSILDEFRHGAEVQASLTVSEIKQRVASSLASMDEENRSVCEARLGAVKSEVARIGEQLTEQFRHGLKAFFYSCLVAALSAVGQHSKTTFDDFSQESENSSPETSSACTSKETIDGHDK